MSTRCNIVVIDVFGGNRTIESLFQNPQLITLDEANNIDNETILYIHNDGYPSGVGRRLLGLFCEKEVKNATQSARALMIHKEMYAKIDQEIYDGIEYLYLVTQTHIHFYQIMYEERTIEQFKLIDSYEIG